MKNTNLVIVGLTALVMGGAGLLIGRALPLPGAAKTTADAAGDAEQPSDRLEMDAAQIAAAQITLAPAGAGDLSTAIVTQATVAASSQGQAVLAARADGTVTRILRRLGDPVRAGETVALIESREASSIVSEQAAARAKAAAARSAFVREKRLFEARVTARQDYEAAQSELAQAEAELRRTGAAASAARISADGRSLAVVSPISGRITAAPAVLGAYVSAGTELFRIADPGRIEIQASLTAADSARVRPEDPATLETGDRRIAAVVRSITPGLDPESRAATAVLTAPGGLAGLQPGQSMRARITPTAAAAPADRVVVAEEAVQSVGGRDVVFVRTRSGFQVRPVRTGARGTGEIEILSGLRAGEVVAVRNAFLLKAELTKGAGEEGE